MFCIETRYKKRWNDKIFGEIFCSKSDNGFHRNIIPIGKEGKDFASALNTPDFETLEEAEGYVEKLMDKIRFHVKVLRTTLPKETIKTSKVTL